MCILGFLILTLVWNSETNKHTLHKSPKIWAARRSFLGLHVFNKVLAFKSTGQKTRGQKTSLTGLEGGQKGTNLQSLQDLAGRCANHHLCLRSHEVGGWYFLKTLKGWLFKWPIIQWSFQWSWICQWVKLDNDQLPELSAKCINSRTLPSSGPQHHWRGTAPFGWTWVEVWTLIFQSFSNYLCCSKYIFISNTLEVFTRSSEIPWKNQNGKANIAFSKVPNSFPRGTA